MTVDREAILREWEVDNAEPEYVGRDYAVPTGRWIASDTELLDLISRAVDAAYEDAARVVEGHLVSSSMPLGMTPAMYVSAHLIDTAAAIRALIGGGE